MSKKRSWMKAASRVDSPKHKKFLKKKRSKARRRVPFGEEKSFEKSTDAWDLD
jgi:hypothetical protein